MDVMLTWAELTMAAHVGVLRRIKALQKGRKEPYGAVVDTWGSDIEGAAGELVVARVLDRHWTGALDMGAGGDVGPVQVRTRAAKAGAGDAWHAAQHLPVHPEDSDDAPFVMVLGRDREYEVVGWIYGRDAKQEQWWRAVAPGRTPSYWVPRSALHPVESLITAAV